MHRFGSTNVPRSKLTPRIPRQAGGGFAGLALVDLLSRDGFFASAASSGDSRRRLAVGSEEAALSG